MSATEGPWRLALGEEALAATPPIGVIAGSGLQVLPELRDAEECAVETAFGQPSAPVLLGRIGGVPVAVLRRHGVGHAIAPDEINVAANVMALKTLGVRCVVSLSAVGSLTEEAPPGTFVTVDQFIDRTSGRRRSFFGRGLVGHVPFGSPVCRDTAAVLRDSLRDMGHPHRAGGTYVVIDGPQFSTRFEVDLYRVWGGHVVGMTAMPEARLCREAELCYALVGMVTDFDCWHSDHADVTAAAVEAVMATNAAAAGELLRVALPRLAASPQLCRQGCGHALDGAIMTASAARDPDLIARLQPILARSAAAADLKGDNG